ncbi:Holliday junction branch migration protein RuvA [Candidatus Uhrbacteria bacterium]|nr:Holliday junction branch migration protein RuvA [Candidatus Uhrbacteria bacterium]
MIRTLRGTVLELHAGFCILEVSGLGYEIRTTVSNLSHLSTILGQSILLYIHDHIREDSHDVYGFNQYSDLELFERLISVSGVGPKVALLIMSAGSASSVKKAILDGNLTFLTSISGVGKKTAQKIVLDLKGHLVEEEGFGENDTEVIEALVSLGYASDDARKAVQILSPEITEVSARIREALKKLSKKVK